MSSTRNSLVLGCFTQLPPEELRVFARSLRSSGFKGRLVLFCAGHGSRDRREIASMADEVIDLSASSTDDAAPWGQSALRYARSTHGLRRHYPTLFRLRARLSTERSALSTWYKLERSLEGLQSLRYGLYRSYLESAEDTDQVLIADVRDVLFQADPFLARCSGLEVFEESANSSIGSDHFNKQWVQDLVGKRKSDSMMSRPILCSGTTAGDRPSMLRYLHAMEREVIWRRRPMGSHDQGLHNILAYGELAGIAKISKNGAARVLTAGQVSALRLDGSDRVLNDDGTIVPVVHQYDRHPDFAARTKARYSLSD